MVSRGIISQRMSTAPRPFTKSVIPTSVCFTTQGSAGAQERRLKQDQLPVYMVLLLRPSRVAMNTCLPPLSPLLSPRPLPSDTIAQLALVMNAVFGPFVEKVDDRLYSGANCVVRGRRYDVWGTVGVTRYRHRPRGLSARGHFCMKVARRFLASDEDDLPTNEMVSSCAKGRVNWSEMTDG